MIQKIYNSVNINSLQKIIPANSGIFAIIDNKVEEYFAGFKNWNFICVDASEDIKSLEAVGKICSVLMDMHADRDCFIIGAGGGVTTDLAGFVASVYKRGVRFGLVPTTLLAACDAAIGGKNGVNHNGLKNMVGTTTLPEWTFQSTLFFKTLPERVFKEGIAEMLKTFLISDKDLYRESVDFFKKTTVAKKERTLRKLIQECALQKMRIIGDDLNDTEQRRLLNLGHTFGHALESYFIQKQGGDILHGEAVAAGIIASAKISVKMGLLKNDESQAIVQDFKDCGILSDYGIPALRLFKYINQDKKIRGDKLHLILPVKTGKAKGIDISPQELKNLCKGLDL